MTRLANVQLFKGLDLDLAPFEARSNWRRFDPEEVLVDFDELSTDVYFLLSGEVRVLMRTASGKEVILNEMKPGEVFGELAALDGIKRSANVTALTRGEACVMPAAVFKELLFANWPVAERLFCLMASRLRELNAKFMEQTVLDLRHRLYSELLRLSVPRSDRAGERVITPPPFHHIVAARIGCRREQITREFSMLTQEGLIERTRGALILRQPEVLKARVAEAMRADH
ncbi:Crp/Fnr family transcriptional regulator [Microvirga makkahensis]|uniref:Cyclic nucleotide-binding domain-containing protein n=1 Tax=Microvirga makkahensis TaxID=1128670 RepID=A0A7X3MSX5_9HYPH|nr:Crp/Fnr family transcriptional regulator [Microvirga makkahensis]MXQ12556.1 cyclic nucleotide-binding domain-containing protein [Microvirga makkahensis]